MAKHNSGRKTYRLKTVEAEQLTFNPENEDDKTNADDLAEWSGGRQVWAPVNGQLQPQLVFETREGTRVANVGDYVVKTGDDSFTRVTQKDFESTYEEGK